MKVKTYGKFVKPITATPHQQRRAAELRKRMLLQRSQRRSKSPCQDQNA